ncbi:MAG TPA: hypothetical protein VG318_13015 [Actinomycetota bacterium]|nr:hypothetical protein [Actinomycetota bacterium]
MRKGIQALVLTGALVAAGVVAGPAGAAKKCKPMTPAEAGADKPTIVVTDAATAEAPLVQTVTLEPSIADARLVSNIPEEGPLAASRDYFNVQVDTKLKSAGLYVTFEFDEHHDYDLWAYFSDGTGAASSHGFQPGLATPFANTDSNHGGESTSSSESLVGIITKDCGGYTIETSNYLGVGGEFEVKVWLGAGEILPGVPE